MENMFSFHITGFGNELICKLVSLVVKTDSCIITFQYYLFGKLTCSLLEKPCFLE